MEPSFLVGVVEFGRWLEAAQSGSAEALGRLLQTCRDYLLAVANAELPADLRAKGGASDLVQETFLKAAHEFASFRGTTEAELLVWLRTILLNNLANFYRQYHGTDKRQVQREIALDDLPPGTVRHQETPSGALQGRESDEALARALEQLPEHYRQVIQWRNYDSLSFDAIGRRLGRTEEAARKLWVRALQQLQQLLGPVDEST